MPQQATSNAINLKTYNSHLSTLPCIIQFGSWQSQICFNEDDIQCKHFIITLHSNKLIQNLFRLVKANSNIGQLWHKIMILSFSEVSDHTLLICESLTLKVCESMCCSIYLIARSVEFDITMSQYKSATVNLFCHSACWVRAILFCWDGVLFTFSQLTQLWKLILIGFHSIWFHHQCHEKHCEVWLSNPTPLTTCWWSVRPLPKSTIP